MKLSELPLEQVTRDNRDLIHRILFEGMKDDVENGEIILVFGSQKATRYRVPVAVELYQANRAPKIVMSGGGKMDVPEARQMADKAIELGVPADDIWMESNSNHTTENVTESMKLLERTVGLDKLNRILIVTTHYHMRRCYLTLKTHMPSHIEYSFCPANDLSTRQDNWWTNEKGTERVIREARALIDYSRRGIINDFEINV